MGCFAKEKDSTYPALAAAALAGLDLNGEHALETLRRGQGPLPVGGRCLTAIVEDGGPLARTWAARWGAQVIARIEEADVISRILGHPGGERSTADRDPAPPRRGPPTGTLPI